MYIRAYPFEHVSSDNLMFAGVCQANMPPPMSALRSPGGVCAQASCQRLRKFFFLLPCTGAALCFSFGAYIGTVGPSLARVV